MHVAAVGRAVRQCDGERRVACSFSGGGESADRYGRQVDGEVNAAAAVAVDAAGLGSNLAGKVNLTICCENTLGTKGGTGNDHCTESFDFHESNLREI
ncbi:hypothetical protein D9M68_760340 [compost metagenome]